MKRKIGGNMFILTSKYDYPDTLNIISKSREALEEIALSLFEEDTYEWFCVLNEEEELYITFAEIFEEAQDKGETPSVLVKQ